MGHDDRIDRRSAISEFIRSGNLAEAFRHIPTHSNLEVGAPLTRTQLGLDCEGSFEPILLGLSELRLHDRARMMQDEKHGLCWLHRYRAECSAQQLPQRAKEVMRNPAIPLILRFDTIFPDLPIYGRDRSIRSTLSIYEGKKQTAGHAGRASIQLLTLDKLTPQERVAFLADILMHQKKPSVLTMRAGCALAYAVGNPADKIEDQIDTWGRTPGFGLAFTPSEEGFFYVNQLHVKQAHRAYPGYRQSYY